MALDLIGEEKFCAMLPWAYWPARPRGRSSTLGVGSGEVVDRQLDLGHLHVR